MPSNHNFKYEEKESIMFYQVFEIMIAWHFHFSDFPFF